MFASFPFCCINSSLGFALSFLALLYRRDILPFTSEKLAWEIYVLILHGSPLIYAADPNPTARIVCEMERKLCE